MMSTVSSATDPDPDKTRSRATAFALSRLSDNDDDSSAKSCWKDKLCVAMRLEGSAAQVYPMPAPGKKVTRCTSP